jgi:hypothetical protein
MGIQKVNKKKLTHSLEGKQEIELTLSSSIRQKNLDEVMTHTEK